MKTLYKYQQEMVDRAGNSTALFWDMGLGKTVASLEVFKKHNLKRLFVICPVSMINEWCREFESQVGYKSLPYKDMVRQAKGNPRLFMDKNLIQMVAINYEMVWRGLDLSWIDKDTMIICDESHKIKNPNSKVGKFMKHLKVKTPYKMCLTGTPQSQGFIDYYNQLYFLDIIDMSFASFKERYCVYVDRSFQGVKIKQLDSYRRVGELEKLYLNRCEFLKIERVYDEIIKHNYIPLETTKEYRYAREHRALFYDVDGNINLNKKEIEKFLHNEPSKIEQYQVLDNMGLYRYTLRSLLDSPYKHEWVKEFLEGYDKRVVIFYNYDVELASLRKVVGDRPYSVYNGGEKSLRRFLDNENGVILCNYKSASLGINDLVASNIFIAYSPTDNYLEWEQSKKRIDRDGQLNTPIYYYLESGLENRIYYNLQNGKNFDDLTFTIELAENLF